MTNFARALLYLNKHSQHSTTAWGAVPIQDYTEMWWKGTISEIDECLFEKYKVDTGIRDFVMSNVQVKNESNIVNFQDV